MTFKFNSALLVALCVAAPGATPLALAQTNDPAMQPITLEQCILTALVQNYALQIERLNPEIARHTLTASRGYYDPLFKADVGRRDSTDPGGYDPADFTRDTVSYDAESVVAKLGLEGMLPTGMRYFAGGNYANSYGERDIHYFDSYKVGASLTIQQPLLKNFWTDQGWLTIQVNKKNLKIAELGVVYLSMDIINQVQQAYYDLLAARQSLKALLQLLDMRERFLAGVQRQIDVGMLTPPDAQFAQSQLAMTQGDVVLATNFVTLAENALKILLGPAFTNAMDMPLVPREHLIVVPETLNLTESWMQGLRLRPDLAQLRQDVQKADIDLKYRRNQLFPSLDLVAGYGRRGATVDKPLKAEGRPAIASASEAFNQVGGGDYPSDIVGLIFSLPLSLTTERGNYRASKQLRAQADLLVKQQEEVVMREISDALHSARSNRELVQARRRAVEFTEAALVAEERKLTGGKSTLFFVLDLQRDLATARVAEIRATAEYNKAVSQLRFAEGSLLEAKRITVEYK